MLGSVYRFIISLCARRRLFYLQTLETKCENYHNQFKVKCYNYLVKQNLVPLFCSHYHGQKRQKGVENEKRKEGRKRKEIRGGGGAMCPGSKAIPRYLTLDEIFPVIPIFECPCGDTSNLANIFHYEYTFLFLFELLS